MTIHLQAIITAPGQAEPLVPRATRQEAAAGFKRAGLPVKLGTVVPYRPHTWYMDAPAVVVSLDVEVYEGLSLRAVLTRLASGWYEHQADGRGPVLWLILSELPDA